MSNGTIITLPPYPVGTTATLQPAPGCQVRDPVTLELLDAAGDLVTVDGFWLRRLQCGDVIDVNNPGSLANAGTVTSPRARRAKED